MPQIAPWVLFAIAATLVAGVRGWWVNHTAVTVGHPQHVQVLSSLTTLLIGGGCLVVLRPPAPSNIPTFAFLCVVGGAAYALYGIFSSYAQQFLKLSAYNSAIRLGAFLPLIYYSVALDEKLSPSQWEGILSSAVPLFVVSFLNADPKRGTTERRGVAAVSGAIIALSAVHIVNKAAVLPETNFEEMAFVVGTNLVIAPVILALIMLKRERVVMTRSLVLAGGFAGLLNTLAFVFLLTALRSGNASQVVPVYSAHVFISTATTLSWERRSTVAVFVILVLWAVGSIYFILA